MYIMLIYTHTEERCVMCGQIIPEGRMVCPLCEKDVEEKVAQKQAAQARETFPVLLGFRKRRQSAKRTE